LELIEATGEGKEERAEDVEERGDLGDDVEDGHVEDSVSCQEMEVLAGDPLVQELLRERDRVRERHERERERERSGQTWMD
jgi:hypothetical protein